MPDSNPGLAESPEAHNTEYLGVQLLVITVSFPRFSEDFGGTVVTVEL